MWMDIEGVPADVPIEALQEPEKYKLFSWKPCDWMAEEEGCEEIVWEEAAPLVEHGSIMLVVHDDGEKVRVAATVTHSEVTVIADGEGTVLQSVRSKDPSSYGMRMPSVNGDRFGLMMGSKKNPTPFCIVGDVGLQNLATFTPVWPLGKFMFGPQFVRLGKKRWGWDMGIPGMVSVDAFSGGPVIPFSEADEQIYGVEALAQAGSWFLSIEAYFKEDKSKVKIATVFSDGIERAKPIFDPLPEGDDGNPMFADTHFAWFRGFNNVDLGKYEKVELWASPFSQTNPRETAPYKVSDLNTEFNVQSARLHMGGWGRALFQLGGEQILNVGFTPSEVHVVDVTLKNPPMKMVLPEGQFMQLAAGVTRTHAWFSVDKLGVPRRRYARWRLTSAGTAP